MGAKVRGGAHRASPEDVKRCRVMLTGTLPRILLPSPNKFM